MKKTILIFSFLALVQIGLGQTPRNVEKEAIPFFMFQATYAAQLPGFDTRADFGFTNTVGGSVIYKTESNWLFTLNGNLISGDKVKLSRNTLFGDAITMVNEEIIGTVGIPVSLATFQRGMHFQAEVGKLFPLYPNPNSGIFVQAGIGFLRNRVRIDYQIETQNYPKPLSDDYQYGYDRMRGGLALHGEAGYMLLSNSKIYNLSVSLEVTYARTRHLREYDFRVFYDETGEPHIMGYNDKDKRFNDFYYGIRISWMIPTYQRQPEEYYYY